MLVDWNLLLSLFGVWVEARWGLVVTVVLVVVGGGTEMKVEVGDLFDVEDVQSINQSKSGTESVSAVILGAMAFLCAYVYLHMYIHTIFSETAT